jgi:Na+/H+ antiporter NhaC
MYFDPNILIPILALLMPVFIVGIVFFFRAKERSETQKTIRAAIEKGQDLPKEFMESLQKTQNNTEKSPARDLRNGVILLALAAALVAMDYIDGYNFDDLTGFAAIPGFIGLALLILGFIGNARKLK